MRISSMQMFQTAVAQMQARQADLAKLQAQAGSGKRVLTPADDPSAATQMLGVVSTESSTTQYQSNADAVTTKLQQQETAISSATNTIQRLHDLAVQAGNSTLTDSDRRAIATEVGERLKELTSLANTRDAQGNYLFSGFKVGAQPFVQNSATGTVSYQGDQGVRYVAISPSRTVADGFPGDGVFMSIRNGNGTYVTAAAAANTGTGVIQPQGLTNPATYVPDTYHIQFTSATTFDVVDTTTSTTVLAAQPYSANSPINFNGMSLSISGAPATGDTFTVSPSANQSVFTTVSNMGQALSTSISSPAQQALFSDSINRTLTDLDQTLSKFNDVRATIGARMNTIDAQKTANSDLTGNMQALGSKLEDADMVQTISDLNLTQTTLQAAQLAFAKVQQLSLFNFLR